MLSLMYKCRPESHPEAVFPFTKKIGGKEYRQSLISPRFVKNCTLQRAKSDVEQLRREGWAARVVKFDVMMSGKLNAEYVYIAYERRIKKVNAIGRK